MKNRYILPLVLFVLGSPASGQVAPKVGEKEQSKIEQFSSRSGSIIEKQFVRVGSNKGVDVEIYRVTDLVTKSTLSGVRLSYTAVSSYSSDEKTAALDADEVDGLIKTIELLKSNVFTSARDSYTEIVFASRGGFSAGAFYSSGKWRAFMKLEKYDSRSSVFMEPQDFEKFLELFQQAKDKLK